MNNLHILSKRAEIAQNILKSYNNSPLASDLNDESKWGFTNEDLEKAVTDHFEKADSDTIEKGGKGAVMGEKRMFGGREYVKTADGWKYHGKGGGAKASAASKETPSSSKQQEDEKHEEHDEGHSADINERFSAYSRYVKAVVQGKFKSCIAYGTGGVGKTYTAVAQLEAAGLKGYDEDIHQSDKFVGGEEDEDGDDTVKSTDYDYVKITGKATPAAMYAAMYEHNGKILLFDDCDSVLVQEDAINIFKGALDTSGDGTISYATSKPLKMSNGEEMPKRFKFTGKAIFISNLPADQMPQPLKSRSLRVDLSMSKKQTMERLRFISTNPKTGELSNLKFDNISYKPKDLEDVLSFIDEHKQSMSDLNVRTVGAFLAIKSIADADGVPWRNEARHMIFSKGEEVGLLKGKEDKKLTKYSRKELLELFNKLCKELKVTDANGVPVD